MQTPGMTAIFDTPRRTRNPVPRPLVERLIWERRREMPLVQGSVGGLRTRHVLRNLVDARRALAYCENMKNITVSVDDETYRRARIKAAERDTSVSGMVREFLNRVAGEDSEFERRARQERE